MSIWVSRHEQFLEQELARVREEHKAEIISLREQHKNELEYLRSEVDRLREYVTQGVLAARQPQVPESAEEVKDGMNKLARVVTENFMGLPFQRILQKRQAEWDAEDAKKGKPKLPGNGQIFDTSVPKEKTDGMDSA